MLHGRRLVVVMSGYSAERTLLMATPPVVDEAAPMPAGARAR